MQSPWDKYGLTASAATRKSAASQGRTPSLPRPNRFRLALEESGGLFTLFGQFLSGRADLLPGPYLALLRTVRIQREEMTSPSSLPEIRDRIVQAEWVRSAPCSEVYAATFQDRPIMAEVFLPEAGGYTNSDFHGLERQLSLLKNSPEASVATPAVLEQFREWLAFQADVDRKRGMLRNLADIPFPCVSRFPRVIPDLQSTRCLVYERMEGSPLPEALEDAARSGHALDLWAECLLEQSLLLSFLDADAQPSNYLLLPDGGVGFRTLPALVPVPVEWHGELLQYLTSAIAGNSHRAMQMLSRICAGANPYAVERMLLERLSALQPELRIQSVAPASVVTLQNYWRALGQTSLKPPLFLHLFQRNLSVLGQAAPPQTPQSDVISESLWPVLGRLLQFRIGDVLSSDKSQEWLANSGLFLLTAVRQVAVLLEHVRDNDLALEIESSPEDGRERRRNRRVASVIHSGIGLVLFLFSLRMAQQSSGSLQMAATTAAALCAVAVFILVARID
ncbi:MAG: hypothetical protein HY316_06025 [Acidobacteria bacterium]|nr:hypothetical protein [Acidobacteriota bacterium]